MSSDETGVMPKHNAASLKLLAYCCEFIIDNNIRCAETVHQSDHVSENALGFIEGLCEILGYHEPSEDDE